MGFFDTLFGGTDDSAQKAQLSANRSTQQFIEDQAAQARYDVSRLFPQSQRLLSSSAQQAANIFGQVAPQQLDVLQQGNVGAQQALLAGLPQIQNALLGAPVDFSALQPQQLNFDASALQNVAMPQLTPQVNLDLASAIGNFGQPNNVANANASATLGFPILNNIRF